MRTEGLHRMPPPATCCRCLRRAMSGAVTARWYALRVIPITLAVILGPLIAAVYRLTRSPHAGSDSLSLAQMARGVLCALVFLSLVCSGRVHLLWHRLVRPLLFLAVYAALVSPFVPYSNETMVFATKMVFAILVFAGGFQLAEKQLPSERWLTMCAWIILCLTAVCIGVGVVMGRSVHVYSSRHATAGLMEQTGVASCLLLSTMPVFVRRIPDGGSALAGVALLLASLFFTFRRSALIAAVASIGSTLPANLAGVRHRIPRRRTLMLIGSLILLAGIGLSTEAGVDLLERFRDLSPFEGSGSGRYVFWQISLDHIAHRALYDQLWGEGMGSMKDVMNQRFGHRIGSHNDLLDILHAFGVFGLVGITWWYGELVRFNRRMARASCALGVRALLVIFVLMSLGTGGSLDPGWGFSYATLGFWACQETRTGEVPLCRTFCSLRHVTSRPFPRADNFPLPGRC
jgi:hypothetical protein